CGKILIPQETIPAVEGGHTIVVIPGEKATCVKDGKTEGQYCSTCGLIIAEQKEIKAVGHHTVPSTGKKIIKRAGLFTRGTREYVCTVCGETVTEEYRFSILTWITDMFNRVFSFFAGTLDKVNS
ncbi:MAG: hypothetical protein K6F64_00015, partial [Clostridia bacterium]|nr:hypothetical protein [Clostridia bacterium]